MKNSFFLAATVAAFSLQNCKKEAVEPPPVPCIAPALESNLVGKWAAKRELLGDLTSGTIEFQADGTFIDTARILSPGHFQPAGLTSWKINGDTLVAHYESAISIEESTWKLPLVSNKCDTVSFAAQSFFQLDLVRL